MLIWGRNLPTSSDAVYLFSIIETTDFVSLFIKNFTSVNREGEIQTLGKRQAQTYEEHNLLKLKYNKKGFFPLNLKPQLIIKLIVLEYLSFIYEFIFYQKIFSTLFLLTIMFIFIKLLTKYDVN